MWWNEMLYGKYSFSQDGFKGIWRFLSKLRSFQSALKEMQIAHKTILKLSFNRIFSVPYPNKVQKVWPKEILMADTAQFLLQELFWSTQIWKIVEIVEIWGKWFPSWELRLLRKLWKIQIQISQVSIFQALFRAYFDWVFWVFGYLLPQKMESWKFETFLINIIQSDAKASQTSLFLITTIYRRL